MTILQTLTLRKPLNQDILRPGKGGGGTLTRKPAPHHTSCTGNPSQQKHNTARLRNRRHDRRVWNIRHIRRRPAWSGATPANAAPKARRRTTTRPALTRSVRRQLIRRNQAGARPILQGNIWMWTAQKGREQLFRLQCLRRRRVLGKLAASQIEAPQHLLAAHLRSPGACVKHLRLPRGLLVRRQLAVYVRVHPVLRYPKLFGRLRLRQRVLVRDKPPLTVGGCVHTGGGSSCSKDDNQRKQETSHSQGPRKIQKFKLPNFLQFPRQTEMHHQTCKLHAKRTNVCPV